MTVDSWLILAELTRGTTANSLELVNCSRVEMLLTTILEQPLRIEQMWQEMVKSWGGTMREEMMGREEGTGKGRIHSWRHLYCH